MAQYAVALVGVPAKVAGQVLTTLKAEFSAGHVILSDRTKTWKNSYAVYDPAGIDSALEVCIEAVFGSTKRPLSFCRRPNQQCVISADRRVSKNCGHADQQSCGLKKPNRLIVLYQQSQNDDALLRRLSFSAFAKALPQSCYGHAGKTLEAARTALRAAKAQLEILHPRIKGYGQVPFLLPLRNYKPGAVISLLKNAAKDPQVDELAEKFLQAHWQSAAGGYEDGNIIYKPTTPDISHGGRGSESEAEKALKTEFRLGCEYDAGFHYDVSSLRNNNLAGATFKCVKQGEIRCVVADRYLNIYPDDFIRRTPT